MKAAEVLVQSLEKEGVQWIFGVPGEENLDVLEALRKSKVKLIVTRHEQAAGFMAATVGRLTGNAGAALSTLGPGATNFTTAAAYATLGGFPAFFLTAQKPLHSNRQGNFQKIDVVAMMKPLTKFSQQVTRGDDLAAAFSEAFTVAHTERPGAVHLELPEDVAAEETANGPMPRQKPHYENASDESIEKAAEMIKHAKTPVVLAGEALNRNRACVNLKDFIDQTGLYFFTTQMGKGLIDERHPRFLQTAALSSNDFVHRALEQADVVLSVGHSTFEKPAFRGREGLKVIRLGTVGAQFPEIYEPAHTVLGPMCNSIDRLKEKLRGAAWDFTVFAEAKREIDRELEKDFGDSRFPLIPQRIVADVRKIMPEDGIIALDNGMYKIWFARHYRAYQPNTILLDNALATMGAGLPSAMAVKLVFPKRAVVAICGDGGFMMNSQDLETALRLKLDLVILILCDNAYGMIKWKQQNMQLEDFGLDFGNPDFVKYAESYGAHGHRVERAEDLAPLLAKTLKDGGVHVIEVPIDYSENKKLML